MRFATILTAAAVATASTAQAEEWCGYTARAGAVVECGYSTVTDCETAAGKGGMCFVDPEYALNATPLARQHAAPSIRPQSGARPS
jgi:hypothetical protein